MGNIIGKKYDIEGVVRSVMNEDDNFAYFDGNVSVKKYLLGTKYEEYLDPAEFFNKSQSSLSQMAEQIKKYDGPVNESAHTGTSVNVQNVYTKSVVDDKVVHPVEKHNSHQVNTQSQHQHYNFDNPQPQHQQNHNQPVNHYEHQRPQVQENPEEALFKKLKRSLKMEFDLKVQEMVPTVEFIKMMNDNFETSIIDYLSNQIISKLLSDPQSLRKQIKDQMETTVYGAPREIEIEEEEETEQVTVSVIEPTVEESPKVEVVEVSTEDVIEIENVEVEETVEKPIVSIVEKTQEEVVSVAPVVEVKETDNSAE